MRSKLRRNIGDNENFHRLVFSVGQDIVYISSERKKLTPKHVGLSMSLLHLIRSKTILTMLSREGHCVSYDEARRIDTEWAKNQVAESSDAKTFGELSDLLLDLVLQMFSTSCSLVSVVCDRHDHKNSIKSEEELEEAEVECKRFKHETE